MTLISSWVLFPPVMATACPTCQNNRKPRTTARARDALVVDLTGPESKRRRIDGVIGIKRHGDQDKVYSFDSSVNAMESDGWIHVRQSQEYLGRIKDLLPCGHLNSEYIESLKPTPVLKVGSVSIQLEGETLASMISPSSSDHQSPPGCLVSTSFSVALFEALGYHAKLNQAILKTRFQLDRHQGSVSLQFDVYLHSNLLSKDLSLSGPFRQERQDLINLVFPAQQKGHYSQDAIVDLYANLHPNSSRVDLPAGVQPEELMPRLLPFQRQSVAWLLSRESAGFREDGEQQVYDRTPTTMERLPLTWEKVTTVLGKELFINRLDGSICLACDDLVAAEQGPRGGILAEEMGLGKTVEMLALILLHKRKASNPEEDKTIVLNGTDTSAPLGLIYSSATLIITPPSILHQWASEIENHAPTLRVFLYVDEVHRSISAEELASYDIVLTTYPALAKEINYTQQYDRPRRFERLYVPRQSPFVKIHWWRVCLDEAQLIEGTTVSQAAAMTLMIPRVISWAVSGTPIKRHIEDLHSLLQFLRQDPLASQKRLWKLLISPPFRPLLIASYQRIMHRHAKSDVAHELILPKQHRLVYGIQFSDIERTHYMDLWEECLQECNLDGDVDFDKMQLWLERLRQTSCHPQIGAWTKGNLGNKDIHTIDTVLGVMLRKVSSQINTKDRALLAVKIKRAILHAHADDIIQAQELLEQVENDIADKVQFWKHKVDQSLDLSQDEGTEAALPFASLSLQPTRRGRAMEDKDGSENPRARYRDWVEQHHRILFFMGAQYSDHGMAVKAAEYNRKAEMIRESMLSDPVVKFQQVVGPVMEAMHSVSLDRGSLMPEPQILGMEGTILSKMSHRFKSLVQLLNKHLRLLGGWRKCLLEILLQPIDLQATDGSDSLMDSYESEISVHAYLNNYSRLFFFRKDLLSSGPSSIASFVRDAQAKKEHQDMMTGRNSRAARRLKSTKVDEDETLHEQLEKQMLDPVSPELAFTFKTVVATLESMASSMNTSHNDKIHAKNLTQRMKGLQEDHLAVADFLEKELAQLQILADVRSLYNHQLQAISDTVLVVDSKNPQADIQKCLAEETTLLAGINKLKSRRTYLDNIAATAIPSNTEQQDGGQESVCLICSDNYQYGLLTECGHVFCEACLDKWTKTHSKCPSCKSQIARPKLTKVTMVQSSASSSSRSIAPKEGVCLEDFHRSLSIDSDTTTLRGVCQVPDAIARVRIESGYGSKIDSIVRHIRFLIQEDPSVKCLVFSQWSRLLQLVSESLVLNQVGHVRLDSGAANKSAVQEFKSNKDKHVFMLHAKSQSAGLTLVQATHVFICEPLVNPALIAQAVSRVHRIGQTKEVHFCFGLQLTKTLSFTIRFIELTILDQTFVHYYLTQNTIEFPCFELYERKVNAAKAGSSKRGKARKNKNTVPVIDVDQRPEVTVMTASVGADSQKGQTGELVLENDLKFCFETQLRMMESMSKEMTEDMRERKEAETDKHDVIFVDEVPLEEEFQGKVFVDEDELMSFATISSTATTNKRLERTGPPKKGKYPKSKSASASAGKSKSTSVSVGDAITDGPQFVQRPAVSAKEMVAAIVSKSSSKHPFSAAADPFANQLDSAIQAGLKAIPGRRDSRYNRANAEPASGSQLPDIQAQYLVGSARWESVNANEVKVKNITPTNIPKVAALEHGLDRVLFNPGVHWLRDPRSSVFNYDPYLRSICQPDDFDYDALPAYRTSSRDPALFNVTRLHKAKYMGSTSSMTSILSQFYYLISAWKPLKTNHLSGAFASQPKGFTRLSRAPSTIQLVYKGSGVYAIDADKTFDSSTVLMQLGKSMEKMLTSTPQEFSRFTKKNSWQVTMEERNQPEAFNYINTENFVLRSQLDCEDPRLPGKTFDLKTRAAVAIRLDVHNYEQNQGYQLSKAHGYLESFEREYYDMMRSAFLKYSLQVRIGQMDGIFVAFHNTAKIFGFQYISLDEMDSRLFGTTVMGDECFKNQLRLLNRALDEITAKYPEQDLKITVDTDETVQSMNVWVETMPLGAASSTRGENVVVEFDENGAPEIQPGAELSLWQIVCYSNINSTPTVGPFELNDRGTDVWELRFKIAELKKPHMMNEYRRVKALQAEILSDDKEREAAVAAAALAEGRTPPPSEKTSSSFDAMRDRLRKISEQGRAMAEHEEKQQADGGFLVWEPKGYTKIQEEPAPSKNAEEEIPASIAERMVRKLKNLSADATVAESQFNSGEEEGATARRKWVMPEEPTIHYRPFDAPSKNLRLTIKDLDLIQKSIAGPLKGEEAERLEHLKTKHDQLISTAHPYDDIRFKLMKIPAKPADYETFDRAELERLADAMDLPKSEIPHDMSDNEVRQKLHRASLRYRPKLHLEYFHDHLHKVLSLKDNAKPLRSVEDFRAVEDEEALMRSIRGLNLNNTLIADHERLKLSKADAIKRSVLIHMLFAEKSFSDQDLDRWGLLPRLFDRKKNPFQIMRELGLSAKAANKRTASDNPPEPKSEPKSEPTP
ncbi:E3 ubiquitin-protein ligase SHPRH [Entomortierella parvispora]|uniref:E3 ubiquitin-protein ligase SHPRH n=1 Tax=Entomortierella parvispora TaxID=205924 RepID=A0A9P3LVB0_9FUNG|nr:E3 ubiquitin-protein ligase SHPRH [Entomortierella parvispora]